MTEKRTPASRDLEIAKKINHDIFYDGTDKDTVSRIAQALAEERADERRRVLESEEVMGLKDACNLAYELASRGMKIEASILEKRLSQFQKFREDGNENSTLAG